MKKINFLAKKRNRNKTIFLVSLSLVLLLTINSVPIQAEYTDVTISNYYDGWSWESENGEMVYAAAECEITFRHYYSEYALATEINTTTQDNSILGPPPIPWDFWVVHRVRHKIYTGIDDDDPLFLSEHYYLISIFDTNYNYLWGVPATTGYPVGWVTEYPSAGEVSGPGGIICRWWFNYEYGYSHKFTTKYIGPTHSWVHYYNYHS